MKINHLRHLVKLALLATPILTISPAVANTEVKNVDTAPKFASFLVTSGLQYKQYVLRTTFNHTTGKPDSFEYVVLTKSSDAKSISLPHPLNELGGIKDKLLDGEYITDAKYTASIRSKNNINYQDVMLFTNYGNEYVLQFNADTGKVDNISENENKNHNFGGENIHLWKTLPGQPLNSISSYTSTNLALLGKSNTDSYSLMVPTLDPLHFSKYANIICYTYTKKNGSSADGSTDDLSSRTSDCSIDQLNSDQLQAYKNNKDKFSVNLSENPSNSAAIYFLYSTESRNSFEYTGNITAIGNKLAYHYDNADNTAYSFLKTYNTIVDDPTQINEICPQNGRVSFKFDNEMLNDQSNKHPS